MEMEALFEGLLSYFSVISLFPPKTMHPFRNFLAGLPPRPPHLPPPPPYTKSKLGKNSGYTRPTLFLGWGEGLALCALETPQKRKSVPRLLSNWDCKREEGVVYQELRNEASLWSSKQYGTHQLLRMIDLLVGVAVVAHCIENCFRTLTVLVTWRTQVIKFKKFYHSAIGKGLKIESIRKLGNFYFQWTKTLYQNNSSHITFFFTLFKGYKYN